MKYSLSLVLLLCSCTAFTNTQKTQPWPIKTLDPPPIYALHAQKEEEFKAYVADINAYAYYVFVYARNMNQYAKSKGLGGIGVVPLCERFEPWNRHPIPERVGIDENIKSPEGITRDLAAQLRKILTNYRDDRAAFERALQAHIGSCL